MCVSKCTAAISKWGCIFLYTALLHVCIMYGKTEHYHHHHQQLTASSSSRLLEGLQRTEGGFFCPEKAASLIISGWMGRISAWFSSSSRRDHLIGRPGKTFSLLFCLVNKCCVRIYLFSFFRELRYWWFAVGLGTFIFFYPCILAPELTALAKNVVAGQSAPPFSNLQSHLSGKKRLTRTYKKQETKGVEG